MRAFAGVALVLVLIVGCGSSVPVLEAPPFEINGAPVVYEPAEDLSGLCASQLRGGLGFILWDRSEWDEAPLWRKAFCLGHEFGHLQCPDCGESSSDCSGVRWMKAAGYLSGSAEGAMLAEIALWPGSEVHPGGLLRVLGIMACLYAVRD